MNTQRAMVYIVDDDSAFRKSVERLLDASGFKAAGFESAAAFLKQDRHQHPSCLLLDMQLPDMNGFELQQKFRECGVGLPIVFMTGHGTIPMSVQAMKNGAFDFLPKPFSTDALQDALRQALERDRENMEQERQTSQIHELLESLTPRENEVLRWVITGSLNKQIAAALGTTEKTVKVHRGRVMKKTKVSSVAELVRLAEKVHISPAVHSAFC